MKVFRTVDLPAADRFDAWQELLGQTHAPVHLSSDFANNFDATLHQFNLGEITLWPATYPHLTWHRPPRLVRQSDPESCHLTLVLRGDGVAQWDRSERVLGPYDFHTNHTSVPYLIHCRPGQHEMIGVELPKSSLGLPWDRVRQVIGQGLSAENGIGTLLAQFLTQVTRDAVSYAPAEAPRLGGVLTDLVTGLFARALDADEHVPPETRTRNLALEVKAFIRRNLWDADLTPSAVAATHHISRSYLYRLFHAEGGTVAAYIRTQRLEAVRRALADTSASAVPIHTIAARCGFRDHATFTRSFRAAYGITPRDYRQAARL
ncbi:AraC family transcriptional regulator [Actinacidiphila yanglinensis]|uniref:AraC family transcriptional regulator n=1 Tax=Actinacidiphila yanglinensis TaxID=310779 RepID=UPI001F46D055|nr:AraC family transcriptional regulator [Actinacidiphila yanglinensis]